MPVVETPCTKCPHCGENPQQPPLQIIHHDYISPERIAKAWEFQDNTFKRRQLWASIFITIAILASLAMALIALYNYHVATVTCPNKATEEISR